MLPKTIPDATEPRRLHVMALDPFHGGSHQAFLHGVIGHSRHAWTLVTGKPVHWKWRMRLAPLELATAAGKAIAADGHPDVILCTDMLDLAQWRGMLRDPLLMQIPTAIYFHENQWTYPKSPEARVDFHYGYTNLLSAIAADICLFNSVFHRSDFLASSRQFIDRMPDGKDAHNFDRLIERCAVIPPGFDPPWEHPPEPRDCEDVLTIGWVSRWEHDKRPDRFLQLLNTLDSRGIDFRLVLLGSRPSRLPEAYSRIVISYSDRILHDAYAEARQDYWSWLQRIDVVVSTADHEFFGIAICEAIWAGAIPVLPDRLSYPELAPANCRYRSLDGAASMIEHFSHSSIRESLADTCRASVEPLRAQHTVHRLDKVLDDLVERGC